MSRNLVWLLAFVSVLLGAPAPRTVLAAPDAPAATADPLEQKESAARAKAADELVSLARVCVTYKAYDDARQAYGRALALHPAHTKVQPELEKLKGKAGAPRKQVAAQVEAKRRKSLAKAGQLLAPVAAAYAKADRSDDLGRIVALLRAQELPFEGPLAKLEVVFFEPYLDWRSKKDVERLEAGWEYLDGAWIEPAQVAALDAEHSDWKNPWKVSDEVHEVRTTLPLRTAKQVLARVAAFRRFFLDYFSGEWDLRTPGVKLPVIVTATRAEMEAQMTETTGGALPIPSQAAAFYLQGSDDGMPCFVSLEICGADGMRETVELPDLLWALEHEVGHQIAFEYSKHGWDRQRLIAHHFWVVEGVAEYLPSYDLVEGAWVLRLPESIPIGKARGEAAFAWCKENADQLPPLGRWLRTPRNEFSTVQNYHIAATLSFFLLEGRDRALRPGFIELLESVHEVREKPESLEDSFDGLDLGTLDAEFREFCRNLEIQPDRR